jgi:NAD(P)-dependent dehydrogenase (short-subunit alcohol dehydrogenase family)
MPTDPRCAGPRPPFPAPHFATPGRLATLAPSPDHGEKTYRGADRLVGCAAIVTEGDSGIGRAVAIALAREGADVAIACFKEEAEAEETAHWVRRAGRRAILVAGDIRDEEQRERLLDRTLGAFGRMDVLVNHTAFEWAHEPVGDLPATDIEALLRTSSESVFFLSTATASRMKPGSCIINTTAVQSGHPIAQQRAYAAYHSAVSTFTPGLARQCAAQGIRVNAVAPGPIWTPRLLATLTAEEATKFGADTLVGRPAQPAEVAPVYVFLASNEAMFVTGAVLSVADGTMAPR